MIFKIDASIDEFVDASTKNVATSTKILKVDGSSGRLTETLGMIWAKWGGRTTTSSYLF
jgi:hypothetical protein